MRRRKRISTWLLPLLFIAVVSAMKATPVAAQIVVPTSSANSTVPGNYVANLDDQMINQLRAFKTDQQAYIRYVTNLVKANQLDARLVVAVYRYSIRRQPTYPFPYFERAMRIEARKRGINLPPAKLINVPPGTVSSPTATLR